MPYGSDHVFRVAVRQNSSYSGDIVNVFHFQTDFAATLTDEEVTDGIIAAMEALYANIEAHVSNTVAPIDIKIDEVEYSAGKETIVANLGTFTWGTNYSPSGSGDRLPPGAAALVKGLTTLGKVYGRKFIGGLLESIQEGGGLSGTGYTALVNFAADYLAGYAIQVGYDLIAGVMSDRLAQFVAFADADVSTNVAYQRRRRKGVGS